MDSGHNSARYPINGFPTTPSYTPDPTFRSSAQIPAPERSLAECQLDTGSFGACTSPQNYTGLAKDHTPFRLERSTLSVMSNITPATYTWTIIFPVSVTASQGTTGPITYLTLKSALNAINGGIHRGNVDINIVGNTIETSSAVLFASGFGNSAYSSVHIQPSGGAARSITGDIAGPLIDLDGARNVLVNGLNNGNSLTITNNSGDPKWSTLRLIHDASLNTFFTRSSPEPPVNHRIPASV